MPNDLTAKDYKIRLSIHRNWRRKIDSSITSKTICSNFGRNSMTVTKTRYWYKRFDKKDTEIFRRHSFLQISSTQLDKPNNLLDSMILLADDPDIKGHISTKNGRFMVFPTQNKESKSCISVYDLFTREHRLNPLSLQARITASDFVGDYFLCAEYNYQGDRSFKLHTLKIDYNDLSVKELKTVKLTQNLSYCYIVGDELKNDGKFVIWDQNDNKIVTGQIKDNGQEIVIGIAKNFSKFQLDGKRLMGNILEGFIHDRDTANLNELKLCEFNVDTLDKKDRSVEIKLENEEEKSLSRFYPHQYSWRENRFYGIFQTNNYQYKLLAFDSKTSKWTDVKILTEIPMALFVDENDVMTFQVGNYNESYGYYRIGLRKPDTLRNLTKLTAIRESNLYGNDEYIKGIKCLGL